MRLWFCHVTGGVHNYNFHKYLSEDLIAEYRQQGCKITRIEYIGDDYNY